ncbi:YciI family protein [Herpetosiphon llansteffanensis]
MAHFMLEITYTVPLEQIETKLAEHRAFLQAGYDQGLLLSSGPQNPRIGGIVIARAASLAAIQAFFANDPYQIANFAEYRFVEFNPVKYQPWLEEWMTSNVE